MRYSTIDNFLFINNRSKLNALLPANSILVLQSAEKMPRNGDQFFPFRQQSDFFYLTGIEQDKASLIIYPDCPNPAYRELLFIEQFDPVTAVWEGHKLSPAEASAISGIQQVQTNESFAIVLQEAMNYAENVFLNNNEYSKFLTDVPGNQLRMTHQLKERYPLHKYERAAPLLTSLRVCKSALEVELLRKACQITGKAFKRIAGFVKPGKYEFEVQAEMEHEFTMNRANGHGYYPIIASGIDSCILHYNENNKQLNDGDLLLLDFGAEYANYTADLSRTLPVNGKFSERQRQCYDAVLRVFKKARELYTPGNTINGINEACWKMMEAEMISLGLFTADDVLKQDPAAPLYRKYLMHGIAHPLGLDVHDVGSKFEPLKPGMVLTCEPGLYIPEEKIGIRLENDMLVTEKEPIDLIADIPIEANDIEALMRQTI
jgi:Xaa-Pro aminopeptidase